jgi:hypothetical protein
MKRFRLTGNKLKIIAMITMFIDHIGAFIVGRTLLYNNSKLPWSYGQIMGAYDVFRAIGRIAFPIFCFLLVEGFKHTKDIKKYILRLLIFATLSEPCMDLVAHRKLIYVDYQNVFWTLLIGLIMMWGMEYCKDKLKILKHNPHLLKTKNIFNKRFIWYITLIIIPILAGYACYFLKTDYSYRGIILILSLYLFKDKPIWQVISGIIGIIIMCYLRKWGWWALLSIPLICLYNGQKGKKTKIGTLAFYSFYPIHQLVIYGVIKILEIWL